MSEVWVSCRDVEMGRAPVFVRVRGRELKCERRERESEGE